MKWIQFIGMIFRQGNLSQQPMDYEAQRTALLTDINTSGVIQTRPSILSLLLKNKLGYSIVANLSYLKHSPRMNIMYFPSDNQKLVYVRILKSASTSMLKAYLPFIDSRLAGANLSSAQVDALGFHYNKRRLTVEQDKYPKLALVRNPFARLVSVFLDLFDPASAFTYGTYCFGILRQNMTFKEFVAAISKIPASLLGPHFASQFYILKQASALNGNIFRIDKDKPALDEFLNAYSLVLTHENVQTKAYDYRSFYDVETLKLAHTLYADDVREFRYDVEYSALRHHVKSNASPNTPGLNDGVRS